MLTSSSYFGSPNPFSGYNPSSVTSKTEPLPKPDPVDPYGFSKRAEEKGKAAPRTASGASGTQSGDSSQSWQSRLNALNKSMSWRNMQQQGQDSGLNFVGGGGAQSLGDGLFSVTPLIYQEGAPAAGGNTAGSIIGGAISGASAGSVFGPLGAGIGAALGVAGGILNRG